MLKTQQTEGIKRVTKKGANQVGVEFATADLANKFVKASIYSLFSDFGYEPYIPQALVTCKGIIRSMDVKIEPEEIVEHMQSVCKIVSARR